MRLAGIWVVVLSGSVWAQAAEGEKASPEAARAREATDLARRAAEEYSIRLGGSGTPLSLVKAPLLEWSNPVVGSIHGSVFVWTAKGRPEVVASIYKWYSPNHHLGVEFHSLAGGPIVAKRREAEVWNTPRGVELQPIPGAPAPAESPRQRLLQIRALAKQFTAVETDRQGVVRELRLLTQPVYRYEKTELPLVDGALFAFVEGTDPEVFLLIEARRVEGKGLVWHYGLSRMNSVKLEVTHRGTKVWSLPEIPWSRVFDHREAYTLFTFQPGDGVNPPGPPDPAPGR